MVDTIVVDQTQLAAALDKERMLRACRNLGQDVKYQPLSDVKVEVFIQDWPMDGFIVPFATRIDEAGRVLDTVLFCFDSPYQYGQAVASSHVIKMVSIPNGGGFVLVALECVYTASYDN